MPPKHSANGGEVRTVALASIDVEDGFNPRSRLDRTALERLTSSIRQHGVLQPVTVAEAGEGRYRHRRPPPLRGREHARPGRAARAGPCGL